MIIAALLEVQRVSQKKKKQKPSRRAVLTVNVEEIDQIIDKAGQEPLNQDECKHLRNTVHAMAAQLQKQHRTTEKSKELFGGEADPVEASTTDKDGGGSESDSGIKNENGGESDKASPEARPTRRGGRGRNGAADYTGATIVPVPCKEVTPKSLCPGCIKGKVYEKLPCPPLIRITGMPPIQATVYQLQSLRCNLCGQLYTAEPPQDIGEEKYDQSVPAMVGVLKYGSGMPFTRIEKLQNQMGIPLPAGTQCDLINEAALKLMHVGEELNRLAAQAEVLTFDDTVARILDDVERPETQDEDRTGLKTTGIVAEVGDRKISLFVTGPQHAGENIGDLLRQREKDLPPVVGMADALACNNPKIPPGVVLLLSNCLTHGRRQFVDIFENFPNECRHVIEQLGLVYLHDEEARDRGLSPEERLSLHLQKSAPVMGELKGWMEAQLADKKTEPNSELGKAIKYFLKRWDRLTLFLRHPGSPLDSNVVERALKKAILNRKNAYFYKTQHGARVGDLFMTLIHTCELNGINPFDYLYQVLRHAAEAQACPAAWLPWNFHLQLHPVSE